MIVNRHIDREPCGSFRGLVESLPDSEFLNLTRSTIPLLAYWSDSSRIEPFLQSFGLSPGSADLHFEFQVPSVGRARASHTDLMVLTDDAAIGIEGKSTEPSYETIGTWLSRGGEGRERVLDHWLGLIEQATGHPPAGSIDHLTYQMVHRLASVCALDKPNRAMVYQVFDVGTSLPDYVGELQHLVDALVPSRSVDIHLQVIPTQQTAQFRELESMMRDMPEEHRPNAVRRGLADLDLFGFAAPLVTHITASGPER